MTTGTTLGRQPQAHTRKAPQWSPVVTTGTTSFTRPTIPPSMYAPQWSPVVTTGTTRNVAPCEGSPSAPPQWSPVVTTGTTAINVHGSLSPDEPQWSPVVTTGTTRKHGQQRLVGDAAMEPRRDDGDDRVLDDVEHP